MRRKRECGITRKRNLQVTIKGKVQAYMYIYGLHLALTQMIILNNFFISKICSNFEPDSFVEFYSQNETKKRPL